MDPVSAEATLGLALTHLELNGPQMALDVLEQASADPKIIARTKARVLEEMEGRESDAAAVKANAPKIKAALMWFLESQNLMIDGHRLGVETPSGKAAFARAEDHFLRAVQASPRVRRAYHFDLAHSAGHCESQEADAKAALERYRLNLIKNSKSKDKKEQE